MNRKINRNYKLIKLFLFSKLNNKRKNEKKRFSIR